MFARRGNSPTDAVLSLSVLCECWSLKWDRGWRSFAARCLECLATFGRGKWQVPWVHIRARHLWALPVQGWDCRLALQSTQLLCSAAVGPQNLTILSSRRKYFRGNFDLINFMCILKLILTTFVLLLASCPCFLDVVSIKFNETLITKLNRSTSQSSQPPPNFWLPSAVSWLCIWSFIPVLPDLSSYSTLLLTANDSLF